MFQPIIDYASQHGLPLVVGETATPPDSASHLGDRGPRMVRRARVRGPLVASAVRRQARLPHVSRDAERGRLDSAATTRR